MPVQKQPTCCRRQTVGGHEQLVIDTAGGQTITLKDGSGVVIEDTNGNSITLDNGKVTVKTSGKLVLQAALIEIDRIDGPSQCSDGAVQWRGESRDARGDQCGRVELHAGCGKCVVRGRPRQSSGPPPVLDRTKRPTQAMQA